MGLAVALGKWLRCWDVFRIVGAGAVCVWSSTKLVIRDRLRNGFTSARRGGRIGCENWA